MPGGGQTKQYLSVAIPAKDGDLLLAAAMSGRRLAILNTEDAEKWKGLTRKFLNVNGDANLFCQYFVESFGTEGDAWDVFECCSGEWPSVEDAQKFDCLFITGSHYSAYDDSVPWIPKLSDVLAQYAQAGVRMVGGCFGCQILGRALGGRVGKNPSGRFVLKVENIEFQQPVADAPRPADATPLPAWRIIESHGDQVLELPEGSQLLASSATAKHEIWMWKGQVLAFQGHPEMPREEAIEKIWTFLKTKGTLSEEEAKSSHTSLSTVPIDAHQFNTFVKNFVASVAPRARSESLEDWASATESPHGDSETTLAAVSTLIQGLLQQAMNMSLMPSLGYLSPGAPPEGSAPGGGGPAEEGAAAAEQRTASSVSSTNSNKPAVTERGKKVGERARWFLGSLSQLLKLELERGGLEYDRLEVANRMTAAEYQKMAEDLRRMKAHAQEFADEQTRLSEEADGCIAELEGLVSKLEIDVKDLEERTKQLSKRPH